MTRSMGLDQPIWVQYGRYLAALASGDFGISRATFRPVAEEDPAVRREVLQIMAHRGGRDLELDGIDHAVQAATEIGELALEGAQLRERLGHLRPAA